MSLLTPRKLVLRVTGAVIVLLAVMLVCALAGTERVRIGAVLRGAGEVAGSNPDYEIFVRVRLPRIVLAAIVGAALASAGVVFQAMLRNPLADPYILGISSGAGLGATIAAVAGLSWAVWGQSAMAVCAFVGALGTVCLVWFIGRLTGKYHVTGLLLGGVIVNAFFSAVIMFLTSVAKSAQVHSTLFWLMGNIGGESTLVLWIAGGVVAAGVLALFNLAPQLNVLTFGQAEAHSIGVNVASTQAAAYTISALLTAIAVSLSGLIGFVGLIVPHAVRLVGGPDHRQLIPISAVAGAALLVAADTVARLVVAPAQLPAGVVTAIVGGPVFLALLVKFSKKVGWQR